jgi:N-carbamoylputrescine amidase
MQLLERGAGAGAQVLVLPELFLHPYFCRQQDASFFSLAHDLETEEIKQLKSFAAEKNVALVVPWFEKRARGLYHNSAALIGVDGSIQGVYRKMHIPDDPGFYEKYYFTPGDLGYQVFETPFGRLGILICWDQWFPEAARACALKGCDVLVYPTAIAWDQKELESLIPEDQVILKNQQVEAWRTIQRSHAIANGMYVAAVNRVGTEGHLDFWGSSFACGPYGEVIGDMGETEEGFYIVDCDLNAIERVRHTWPFLRDRRPESYDILGKFYE